MKYRQEYLETLDREKFINLLISKLKVKRRTAERRWCDVKKLVRIPKYEDNIKKEPSFQLMIQYREMKKFKQLLTRENLNKYGFKEFEINWLEDNGYLDGKSIKK